MRILSGMTILTILAIPCVASAANDCPWMNEATASGILGTVAVGVYAPAQNGQPAQCAFTAAGQSAGLAFSRTLRITEETVSEPHARYSALALSCGADAAPLRAIGNEATICATHERGSASSEWIVGRVRDQVFTITLRSTLKKDPLLTKDALFAKMRIAAEQVSGNLF